MTVDEDMALRQLMRHFRRGYRLARRRYRDAVEREVNFGCKWRESLRGWVGCLLIFKQIERVVGSLSRLTAGWLLCRWGRGDDGGRRTAFEQYDFFFSFLFCMIRNWNTVPFLQRYRIYVYE
jgi:hypothetical protein